MLGRLRTFRFLLTGARQAADGAREELRKVQPALTDGLARLSDPEDIALFERLLPQIRQFEQTFERVVADTAEVNRLRDEVLYRLGNSMSEATGAINDSADRERETVLATFAAVSAAGSWTARIAGVLGVLFGVVIAWLMGRTISRPVQAVTRVMAEIAMARALLSLRDTSAAAARSRSALEHASNCLMMADSDFNIAYMNGALSEMFRRAEADIRHDLPGFDASRLIGANADFFHKEP